MSTALAIEITPEQFEKSVEAFADTADPAIYEITGRKEVPYADIPEGSKEWYRLRMRATFALIGITVSH